MMGSSSKQRRQQQWQVWTAFRAFEAALCSMLGCASGGKGLHRTVQQCACLMCLLLLLLLLCYPAGWQTLKSGRHAPHAMTGNCLYDIP
jgi:hypothetical protein